MKLTLRSACGMANGNSRICAKGDILLTYTFIETQRVATKADAFDNQTFFRVSK